MPRSTILVVSRVPKFSKAIRDVLWGDPFNEVYPKREPPPPPVYDGRTAAMRILKQYFSELTFFRPGGKNELGIEQPPIDFKIPKRDIHVEWPDDEAELHLPALALLANQAADYDSIGMTNYVQENTRDKYAPNTVLIWMSEYIEDFPVEVWAETKQQRRSILAGLEQALSPLQQMAGIRFRMPDYYDQLVVFETLSREIFDDDQATFLRRRARIMLKVRFNVVALVNVQPLVPSTETLVDVEADGTPISMSDVGKPGDPGPEAPG